MLYAKWTKEGEQPVSSGASTPTQSGTDAPKGCGGVVVVVSIVLILCIASVIFVIIKKKRG